MILYTSKFLISMRALLECLFSCDRIVSFFATQCDTKAYIFESFWVSFKVFFLETFYPKTHSIVARAKSNSPFKRSM